MPFGGGKGRPCGGGKGRPPGGGGKPRPAPGGAGPGALGDVSICIVRRGGRVEAKRDLRPPGGPPGMPGKGGGIEPGRPMRASVIQIQMLKRAVAMAEYLGIQTVEVVRQGSRQGNLRSVDLA